MNVYAFAAVGIGAAGGAWLRWLLAMQLNPVFPTLPLGTLAANLLGGYLMGISLGVVEHYDALPPEVRLMITTGFLGGLTTFSTFSAEMVTLFSRGQIAWAIAAVAMHVGGSLSMTALGIITFNWVRS
jgi:CrcB protein